MFDLGVNNEQTSAIIDTPEEVFQQLANGQQDSAQPGVPATMFQENQIESNELVPENNNEINQSNHNSVEEDKEESKEVPNQYFEHKNNQERQGIEDTIRPNHQEEMLNESSFSNNDDNPYKNQAIRKNEQFSFQEKDSAGQQEFSKKFTPKSRKQSKTSALSSNEKSEEKKKSTQPFGYSMTQSRGSNYGSFVAPSSFPETLPYQNQSQAEPVALTSAYLQMSHSRNSNNPSSNTLTDSFQVTNYEDSEFMIQAYQRKKKAYEKCKQKYLQVESDLHMEKQRCKMFQEENKRFKLSIRKLGKYGTIYNIPLYRA